jgi:FkbM family methyltransferase
MNRTEKKSAYILKHFPAVYAFYFLIASLRHRAFYFISQFIPKGFRKHEDIYRSWIEQRIPLTEDETLWKIEYPVNNQPTKITLRKNDSDLYVFNQVILHVGYRTILNLLVDYGIEAPRVIDAGSNIGLTATYFKRFLPQSQIVCIEPSSENVHVLRANLDENQMQDVRVYAKGLWNRNTFLSRKRDFRDNLSWAFAVEEGTERADAIEAITLQEIMNEMKWENADVLKLDIEGAEAALFSDEQTFSYMVSHYRIIAAEIHEEMISSKLVRKKLRDCGMVVFDSGELTVAINTIYK